MPVASSTPLTLDKAVFLAWAVAGFNAEDVATLRPNPAPLTSAIMSGIILTNVANAGLPVKSNPCEPAFV